MKKVVSSTYESNSFADYMDDLNGKLYHANCEAVGSSPDNFRIEVDPTSFNNYPFSVRVETELDSDGESNMIYFLPVITFPELDTSELAFADSASYIVSRWTESVDILTKVMFDNPYVKDI